MLNDLTECVSLDHFLLLETVPFQEMMKQINEIEDIKIKVKIIKNDLVRSTLMINIFLCRK